MENDIMQREKGEIWRSVSKIYYMIPEKRCMTDVTDVILMECLEF